MKLVGREIQIKLYKYLNKKNLILRVDDNKYCYEKSPIKKYIILMLYRYI